MSSARHWCFTHNNYTDCDLEYYAGCGEQLAVPAGNGRKERQLEYLICGREVGDSGTPHIQGYVVFKKRTTLQGARKCFPGTHLAIARGSPQQNRVYCSKSGDFVEYGDIPTGKGKRSDLDELGKRVLSGASTKEIQEDFPGAYIRYKHNIDSAIRERSCVRNWEVDVRIIWGKSGTGKTRSVYEFIDAAQIYTHPGGPWFDGYHGQSVVLFDDYTGSCFKIGYLLKLLDRYPMMVPVKGGFVQFTPKHIFFTSNLDPKTWYENANSEHVVALFRRVKSVIHMS